MTVVTKQRTRAWSNGNFRRLWAGSTASSFGSEIAEIAVPLLALLSLSATAAELSALRVAQFLPFLLATLPLGLLVDRRQRHRLQLMISADVGRFLLIAAIPLAVWQGAANMELLYAVIFIVGILTVLYQVADFAFLPNIVGPDELVDANGKLQATYSASEIAGRGIGGMLVQVATAPVAVVMNALGYLVSAVCLRGIRAPRADDTETEVATGLSRERARARREIWEGLRIALTHRYVRPLVAEATTFNLFNEVLLLGLMLWAVRDLGLSPATIGLIFTAGGVGSFVGAWFGSRITGRFGYGRVLVITLIVGNGAPLALLAVDLLGAAVVALLATVYVVMGAGIGIANVHAISLRQHSLPEHLAGRTNAAYRLMSWGAIPVGAGTGGLIASAAGSQTAMLVGAVGVATATLWIVFSAIPGLRSITDG